MTVAERSALAILEIGLGSRNNARTLWSIWTPDQRAQAATVAAEFLPILERTIDGMTDALSERPSA